MRSGWATHSFDRRECSRCTDVGWASALQFRELLSLGRRPRSHAASDTRLQIVAHELVRANQARSGLYTHRWQTGHGRREGYECRLEESWPRSWKASD